MLTLLLCSSCSCRLNIIAKAGETSVRSRLDVRIPGELAAAGLFDLRLLDSLVVAFGLAIGSTEVYGESFGAMGIQHPCAY